MIITIFAIKELNTKCEIVERNDEDKEVIYERSTVHKEQQKRYTVRKTVVSQFEFD